MGKSLPPDQLQVEFAKKNSPLLPHREDFDHDPASPPGKLQAFPLDDLGDALGSGVIGRFGWHIRHLTHHSHIFPDTFVPHLKLLDALRPTSLSWFGEEGVDGHVTPRKGGLLLLFLAL